MYAQTARIGKERKREGKEKRVKVSRLRARLSREERESRFSIEKPRGRLGACECVTPTPAAFLPRVYYCSLV